MILRGMSPAGALEACLLECRRMERTTRGADPAGFDYTGLRPVVRMSRSAKDALLRDTEVAHRYGWAHRPTARVASAFGYDIIIDDTLGAEVIEPGWPS